MTKYAILNGQSLALSEKDKGMPVVETAPPDVLEYGTKAVARYEQQGSQIVKVWDIQPWTEQDWQNARGDEAQTTAEESTLETNPDT